MAVSLGFRKKMNSAPVVIVTSDTAANTTLAPGWYRMAVTGTPANIADAGLLATLTKGTSTAQVDYTAFGPTTTARGSNNGLYFNPNGADITVTVLAASGILPLSYSVGGATGHDITIQLGSASTSDQVAALINGVTNKLITATGHGAGTVVAFAKTSLAFRAATAADPSYPIGIEDLPTWREGFVTALGTVTGGQVWFTEYMPC